MKSLNQYRWLAYQYKGKKVISNIHTLKNPNCVEANSLIFTKILLGIFLKVVLKLASCTYL